MPAQSDFLLAAVNVMPNTWVRLTNNVSGSSYISTAASNANGMFPMGVIPAGSYTVATGPTATGPWTNTGDNNYPVAPTNLGIFNVLDYGATGDGATNDTVSIQAAITAANTAGGGLVYFPGGTYLCTTLNLSPGVILAGLSASKSKIKLKNTTNNNLIVLTAAPHSGTQIRDLTLDGNGANQTVGNIIDGQAVITYTNFIVERNVLLNAAIHSMIFSELTPGTNPSLKIIRNNVVNDHGIAGTGFGIYFDYAAPALIEGNWVYSHNLNDNIELGHNGNAAAASYNYQCINNTVIGGQLQFPFASGAIIMGNTVINANIQNDANTANDVQIIGNKIVNAPVVNGYSGINVTGARALIKNNRIQITGLAGAYGVGCNAQSGFSDAIIEGNIIETLAATNTGTAVNCGVGSSSTGNLIQGNTIFGKWDVGIQVVGANNTVKNNTLDLTLATATNGIYILPSSISGVLANNVLIEGNRILGNPTNPINVTGVNSNLTGTRVRNNVGYSGANDNIVNVLDFGAIGNGTTDDTSAINSAIAAVNVSGGRVVFPVGTYKVTSALTALSNGVTLEGVSVHVGGIFGDTLTGSVIKITAGAYDLVTSASSAKGIQIRDIFFDGGTDTTHWVVRMFGVSGGLVIRNVGIRQSATGFNGVYFDGGSSGIFDATVDNLAIFCGGGFTGGTGLKVGNTSACNANTFSDIVIQGYITGIDNNNGGGNTYIGTWTQSCTTGMRFNSSECVVLGGWIESLTTAFTFTASAVNNTIIAVRRSGSVTTLISDSGTGTRLISVDGNDVGNITQIGTITGLTGLTLASGDIQQANNTLHKWVGTDSAIRGRITLDASNAFRFTGTGTLPTGTAIISTTDSAAAIIDRITVTGSTAGANATITFGLSNLVLSSGTLNVNNGIAGTNLITIYSGNLIADQPQFKLSKTGVVDWQVQIQAGVGATGLQLYNSINGPTTSFNTAGLITTYNLAITGGQNTFTDTGTTTAANTFTSATLTSGNLIKLTQNTSTMSGTALLMNMATSGSFTGNFFDLQINGTSKFLIDAAGHLISTATGTPTTTNLGANVTSATFTGNDVRGTVAIVMSAGLAANTRCFTATFATSYGATAPKVTLVDQTSGVGLAVVNSYVSAQSTGVSFDVAFDQALVAGTYTIDYIVIG